MIKLSAGSVVLEVFDGYAVITKGDVFLAHIFGDQAISRAIDGFFSINSKVESSSTQQEESASETAA